MAPDVETDTDYKVRAAQTTTACSGWKLPDHAGDLLCHYSYGYGLD
ncbi:putative capsid protein [Salmonella phage 21]|nr:putative capsid protein [Salmonella phage 21]